jgi:twitching motility protein PilT
MEQLSLPNVLQTFCQQRKGLVLCTGPTGSGKSTTLAALIDHVNTTRKGHILTIEDPIEFVHPNKSCLMSQREVGFDTLSFSAALHSALREDPNVILVGEMRDLETISLAVTAAETGILVFGTLHTNGAAATVDRIVNVFAPGDQMRIRSMLSTSLLGVVSQQLVRRSDGKGRVAAMEILVNNPAVSNILRDGKTEQIATAIQSGSLQGMQSMDTALRRLMDAKLITGKDAYRKAINKREFDMFAEPELAA